MGETAAETALVIDLGVVRQTQFTPDLYRNNAFAIYTPMPEITPLAGPLSQENFHCAVDGSLCIG